MGFYVFGEEEVAGEDFGGFFHVFVEAGGFFFVGVAGDGEVDWGGDVGDAAVGGGDEEFKINYIFLVALNIVSLRRFL